MKNLITIILVLIQFPLLSQSLNGKFQIGGSASYLTSSNEYENGLGTDFQKQLNERTNISITPQFGYFITDNISIGGQIGYSTASYSNYYENNLSVSEYNMKNNMLRIGTFTRLHKSVTENFYFFLQGNIEIGFGRTRYEDSQNSDKDSFDFHVGLQPGILYMITEKFGIEGRIGLLGYTSSKASLADSDEAIIDKTERFGLEFNPSNFAFGLQFYL